MSQLIRMIFARYMPVIGLWLGLICAVALPVQGKQERKPFQVSDIFVPGDSQFAFGAGPALSYCQIWCLSALHAAA